MFDYQHIHGFLSFHVLNVYKYSYSKLLFLLQSHQNNVFYDTVCYVTNFILLEA